MKKQPALIQKRNVISLLMVFVFVFTNALAQTQPAPTVYALVTLQKVEPANAVEYEKVMKENWVPLHQLRKQNGKITSWSLYKVHFAGVNEEYNYVSVMYFESFVKTEPNDKYLELMKASNPKGNADAIMTKTQSLRSIARQALYRRQDGTTPKAGATPLKYITVNFMKAKPGMDAEWAKMETEDWKPMHQAMVNDGRRYGWNLWNLVVPGGTGSNHDYVTADIFSSYDQLNGVDYEAYAKKVHPGKSVQQLSDRSAKTRDLVRLELWELVMSIN